MFIIRWLKALYDFFAGDPVILIGTGIAFAGAALLTRIPSSGNLVAALFFLVVIAGGLLTTLNRERRAGKGK